MRIVSEEKKQELNQYINENIKKIKEGREFCYTRKAPDTFSQKSHYQYRIIKLYKNYVLCENIWNHTKECFAYQELLWHAEFAYDKIK